MHNSMYNNIANAYQNLFCGGKVTATMQCSTTLGSLKQPPGRVVQYMFMI